MAADVNIVIGAQDQASSVIQRVAGGVTSLAGGFKLLSPVTIAAASAIASVTAAVVTFNSAAQVVLERAKAIDELAKAAQRVGDSVGSLQAFQFAINEIAGVDADSAREALLELRKIVGEALQGDEGKLDLFAQLGLDAASLSQAGPVEAFSRVRDALSQVENAAQRAAIAEQVLGGEGRKLMGMLSDQSDAFAKSMQAAEDLGLTISDSGAAGVEAMNDALGRVSAAVEGVTTQFVEHLAPAIEVAAESALELFQSLGDIDMRTLVEDMTIFAGHMADALANATALASISLNPAAAGAQFGAGEDLGFQAFTTAEKLLAELSERRKANDQAAADRAVARAEASRAEATVVEKAVKAEEAKETAADKTYAALKKQLAILQLGSDEYERQQQLASAKTDAERSSIAALQGQVAAQEAINKQIEEAEAEQERRKKENPQSGITATEGRLITRGNAGNEQKRMLKTQEDSLAELKRIRDYMSQQARGDSIELVVVGGSV